MKNEWFALREKLLFHTPVADFTGACQQVRTSYREEFENADQSRQKELISILAELSTDMQSYLLRWHLQNPENDAQLSQQIIEEEVLANYILLKAWGAEEKISTIKDEVAAIQRSNFRKISAMTDAGEMNVRLGHDYASGLTKTLRKGGILVTTNPPLVNMARKNDPEFWNAVKDRLKAENPEVSPENLVSLLTMEVVLQSCRELRPIFEATGGKYGHVNLQINPRNSADSTKMAEEIEWLYEKMTQALGGTPNVVFKIPGTRAALETAKRVTGKGIGVTVTVSFAVDQHLAFAEVIEQGTAPVSFLVMMNGRLDDPVKEELQKLEVAGAEDAAKWGSTAIVRRSYAELCQKGCTRSFLLIASLRGPWNIDGSLTDKEQPIFITSFPDKTEQYDSQEREMVSHIEEPMAEDVLDILQQSPMFKQAYEIGGLTVDGFDTFYPVVKTLTSFIEAYDELIEYVTA
ncbi:hypothetical protein CSA56_07535 [candidate division KSB3 bacterium]|uniref:Transaldolase n=1 Tax=candidate division KSB3 bacterium TaxID=2044937 RepID=A0A2G6KFS8_9BACT|nr:MAG: hypothetical protein CSA56_07535 [candidate division KSB3 bacterium]